MGDFFETLLSKKFSGLNLEKKALTFQLVSIRFSIALAFCQSVVRKLEVLGFIHSVRLYYLPVNHHWLREFSSTNLSASHLANSISFSNWDSLACLFNTFSSIFFIMVIGSISKMKMINSRSKQGLDSFFQVFYFFKEYFLIGD